MIRAANCAGGRWVQARVHSLRFRQDDWCEGFFCAYMVKVQGDVGEDGLPVGTPVREDDERCIRAAPPPAPPPPPPRFAIGTRVECNGGSRGWHRGVVVEHWPERPDGPGGEFVPYLVELTAGAAKGHQVLVPHDEDLGIRKELVPEWDDERGVEAVHDLLVGGKLSLPAVGLCGQASAVDALTDAVAACRSEPERIALMVEQVLSTAEQATPGQPLVGKSVRVSGLQSSGGAALNGRCGTAERFVAERDRYQVRMEDGTAVAVRDVNLAPAEEPMVTYDQRYSNAQSPDPAHPAC
jgi:hypothetical protein